MIMVRMLLRKFSSPTAYFIKECISAEWTADMCSFLFLIGTIGYAAIYMLRSKRLFWQNTVPACDPYAEKVHKSIHFKNGRRNKISPVPGEKPGRQGVFLNSFPVKRKAGVTIQGFFLNFRYMEI